MKNPLLEHIQDSQDTATRLSGILAAIEHLDSEETCAPGKTALIQTAYELAKSLALSLDSVNLPEVSA